MLSRRGLPLLFFAGATVHNFGFQWSWFYREETVQCLERRVDLLEKANRRYRYLFLLLLAGLVVACGIQMRGADVLKAKAIEVVSDDGKVLFRVSSAGSGGRLRLFNVWGNTPFEVFNLGSGCRGHSEKRGRQRIS